MTFLSSLPTAKLLVAVLISFLIKEEETSHFPQALDKEWAASFAEIVLAAVWELALKCCVFRGCSRLLRGVSQTRLRPRSLSRPCGSQESSREGSGRWWQTVADGCCGVCGPGGLQRGRWDSPSGSANSSTGNPVRGLGFSGLELFYRCQSCPFMGKCKIALFGNFLNVNACFLLQDRVHLSGCYFLYSCSGPSHQVCVLVA